MSRVSAAMGGGGTGDDLFTSSGASVDAVQGLCRRRRAIRARSVQQCSNAAGEFKARYAGAWFRSRLRNALLQLLASILGGSPSDPHHAFYHGTAARGVYRTV